MNFVQQLFLNGHEIYRATAVLHLGDHRAAVCFDFGDGKGKIPRFRHVFKSRIAEIPAGDLRATFQQMTNAVAAPQTHMIERVPTKFIHHRRHENRRIRHAAGDDNLRTLLQRGNDGFRAQIHFGGHDVVR